MRKNKVRLFTLALSLLISGSAVAAMKIGLVLDKGGRDDKSFNSAAYEGATQAQKQLGIELKYVEVTDANSIDNLYRASAKKDFDLIIGIGFAQADAVKKAASQNPEKKFVIVDGKVDLPNVRSLVFQEHEGSFLVGALAAMKSKSAKIGFVGGMEIPLIKRFVMGYEAGAKYINPKVQVSVQYVGISGDAWNNPAKAKELALAQYASGVDIIFAAAGASGTGVFDAAEESKKLAIGVDSNQDGIKPGFILTSMLKRVDVAVLESIRDITTGKFTGGVAEFGLANKGVDYSVDSFNEKLVTSADKSKLEGIKKQIIAGKIKVPDYYQINSSLGN